MWFKVKADEEAIYHKYLTYNGGHKRPCKLMSELCGLYKEI